MNATTLASSLPNLDSLLAGCLGDGPLLRDRIEPPKPKEPTLSCLINKLLSCKIGDSLKTDEGEIVCNADGTFTVKIKDDVWFDAIYSQVPDVQTATEACEWLQNESAGLNTNEKYQLLQSLNDSTTPESKNVAEILSNFKAWLKVGSYGE